MLARLIESHEIANEVKHFTFEVPEVGKLPYLPGQFVSFSHEILGKKITRAYSTASPPSGNRFEIYGREGTLVISGGSSNVGPNRLHGARGDERLTAMEPPDRFTLVPESVPAGPARNVAQGYARLARALAAGERYQPDFAHAARRHALIAAIERSSAEGRAVRV